MTKDEAEGVDRTESRMDRGENDGMAGVCCNSRIGKTRVVSSLPDERYDGLLGGGGDVHRIAQQVSESGSHVQDH